MLLDFLICGSRLFHSFIVEGKNHYLVPKIRLNISVTIYMNEIIVVAVITLAEQVEIQEQDLMNIKKQMETQKRKNI